MTSCEAREKVETLRDEKRKEKYIRESHRLLIFNEAGGLRRREPYQKTRVLMEWPKEGRC